MGGTKEGAVKRRATLIAKYGSEEAYMEHMKGIARKAGEKARDSGVLAKVGFKHMSPERLREVSRKGGQKSRRGSANK